MDTTGRARKHVVLREYQPMNYAIEQLRHDYEHCRYCSALARDSMHKHGDDRFRSDVRMFVSRAWELREAIRALRLYAAVKAAEGGGCTETTTAISPTRS